MSNIKNLAEKAIDFIDSLREAQYIMKINTYQKTAIIDCLIYTFKEQGILINSNLESFTFNESFTYQKKLDLIRDGINLFNNRFINISYEYLPTDFNQLNVLFIITDIKLRLIFNVVNDSIDLVFLDE